VPDFFNPEINFSAENEDAESTVKSLNENTQSEASYAVSLSYSYFRNKWGFETGLGLSKQNYNCGHQFQVEEIDTSFYWEYYEKEDFLYDTTWYINIDTLLQTGDYFVCSKRRFNNDLGKRFNLPGEI